jgi:hypothetical protein
MELKSKFGSTTAVQLTDAEERRLWQLTVEILRLFSTRWGTIFLRDLDPKVRNMILSFAASGISGALQGFPPKAFPEKKGTSDSAVRRQAILIATAYIHLARSGQISDKNYNRTVREHFGVDDQTVRNWAKRDPKRGLAVIEHYNQNNADRGEEPAARLERLALMVLRNAGRDYQRRVL